jgi:hypothetical protein
MLGRAAASPSDPSVVSDQDGLRDLETFCDVNGFVAANGFGDGDGWDPDAVSSDATGLLPGLSCPRAFDFLASLARTSGVIFLTLGVLAEAGLGTGTVTGGLEAVPASFVAPGEAVDDVLLFVPAAEVLVT